jgi:hypothetical protein
MNELSAPLPRQSKLFTPRSIVPFIATLTCLAVWTVTINPPFFGYLPYGPAAGAAGYLLGVLYFLIQFLGRLFCRQWLGALFAAIRTILCVVATVPAFVLTLFLGAMWQSSQDHFADNLIIPSNIEISRPIQTEDVSALGKDDLFQRQMLVALQKPVGSSATLTPSVPSLRNLVQNHRALLMRYLESSPAWRVYEVRGNLFAARRWQFGSQWISTLTDMYWHANPEGRGNLDGTRNFEVATILYFNGQTWLPPEHFSWMDEGTTPSPVSLSRRNDMNVSSCLIRCGGDVLLEIFEKSTGQERRLTEASLSQIETEFKAVLDRKEFDPSLLPAGSIKRGNASLDLHGEHGFYDAETWVNPGEPGTVYLKAYEITHNTPLATDSLYLDSNERIGWSSDAQELFLSATHIKMSPGGPGKPYAARFELWFKPDSGGPERKLLTRNFVVEGW